MKPRPVAPVFPCGVWMKLVVGIGNPGSEYCRHAAQRRFRSNRRVRRPGSAGSVAGQFDRMAKTAFDALTFSGVVGDEKVLAAEAVNVRQSQWPLGAGGNELLSCNAGRLIVVVLDDLALPCGAIRLRSEGSSGGHNGLKDIQRAIGTDRYPRLRIGHRSGAGADGGKRLCARPIYGRAT